MELKIRYENEMQTIELDSAATDQLWVTLYGVYRLKHGLLIQKTRELSSRFLLSSAEKSRRKERGIVYAERKNGGKRKKINTKRREKICIKLFRQVQILNGKTEKS